MLAVAYTKEEWSQSGVYQISNLMNGKSYIGSAAVNFRKRWWNHQSDLRLNKHHSEYLQRSWNKYGETQFAFIILEVCPADMCINAEQKWMNKLHPEYNSCPLAKSPLGYKHTKETRLKMSIARIGITYSDETKSRMSAARTNTTHSEKTKLKMSASSKKIKTCTKLTEAQVIEIRNLYINNKYKQKDLAVLFNVHQSQISLIVNNKQWQNLQNKTG